jgi:hypothetical protein
VTESPSIPAVSTFVIRLWYEWTAEGPRWRGQIEHVQSGRSAAFLDVDTLLHFLRRFGVEADDPRLPAPDEL